MDSRGRGCHEDLDKCKAAVAVKFLEVEVLRDVRASERGLRSGQQGQGWTAP